MYRSCAICRSSQSSSCDGIARSILRGGIEDRREEQRVEKQLVGAVPVATEVRVVSKQDDAAGARAGRLEDLDNFGWDILVNATPVGGELPASVEDVRSGSVVLDMVYEPERTALLEAAGRAGAQVGCRDPQLAHVVEQLPHALGPLPRLGEELGEAAVGLEVDREGAVRAILAAFIVDDRDVALPTRLVPAAVTDPSARRSISQSTGENVLGR